MSLRSDDGRTPPLFRRTASPPMRLAVAVAAALFLMIADARLHVGTVIRTSIATILMPLQWLSTQPVKAVNLLGDYVVTVEAAQQTKEEATLQMAQLALKAQRAELLERENANLRSLLALQQNLSIHARAAQVKYVAADPFKRTLVLDKGGLQGIVKGAPVIDGHGLVGQVVRVYPSTSEVRLLNNPEQAIPAINHRTGKRSLVYGDAQATEGNALEMRFMPLIADIQKGDKIATSGVGGVYPAGLPVGIVDTVDKRSHSNFLQVRLTPAAQFDKVSHVLVIDPQPSDVPQDINTTPQKNATKTAKEARP